MKGRLQTVAKSKVRVCSNPNPMVDNRTIRKAIISSDWTFEEFAEQIDLCYHTLNSRLDDGRWTVLEAYKVCKLLNLSFEDVFFAHPERLPGVA